MTTGLTLGNMTPSPLCLIVRAFTCLLQLCLVLGATSSSAAEPLLKDVHYQDQEGFDQLEIRLGFPVEITGIIATDSEQLRIALKPVTAGARGWSSAELRFDEADRLLEKVSIEGSGRKGYELVASFSSPIKAQLLPQFDERQVLIKLVRQQEFRTLSRFGKVRKADPFVINLESRKHSVPGLQDIPKGFAETHTVYLTDFEQGDVLWHRLRLGFFPDQLTAARTVRTLKRYFPDAWIEQVSEGEVKFAETFRINPAQQIARVSGRDAELVQVPSTEVKLAVALVTPSSIGAEPPPPEPPEKQWEKRAVVAEPEPGELDQLLADARSAFEAEDYAESITLYTKLLMADTEPFRQQALEMLGVSRELNRQLAHAKRHYETYLNEYPNTDGAGRVQQRLYTLLALDRPRPKAATTLARRAPQAWDLNAYFSQFYQRHSLKVDDRSSVPIDGVFNDFNLMARRDGTDLDQEVRITMNYLLDFTDNERLSGREFQISTAYWEGASERLRSGIRVGRQTRWDSGALGRFDGASYTWRATGKMAVGLTGGYLVDSSFDAPDTNRPFFGVNGEYLSDSGNLIIKPFFVQQYVDGVVDRQALGIQTQYNTQRSMLFSLVDYDMHHSALNNFTLMGNFRLGSSQLNASYEHRKNPYLTTRNALVGQPFEDLTELEEAILDLTLEEIASDRTASSDTLRLGWNTRLGEHWVLSADLVTSDFSPTESSVEVTGLEAHKTLYSSFQVRSMDVFGRGSYSAVMLRVADSETSNTTSIYWDNRFRIGEGWQFYPRLRVDQRSFERNGDKQLTVRPSLRLDFRMSRRLRFELESGYQWSTRDMGARQLDITGLFLRAGYRANF